MDLVDEKHIVRLQVGELGREIAGLLDHRPRGRAEAHAHLAGDDLRHRRLAEPRWAVQQDMIQRLTAPLGRRDEDLEILADLLLADEIVERLRPQRHFRGVFLGALGRDQPVAAFFELSVHRASSCRPARITASSLASAPSRWVTRATAPKASIRL